MLHLFFLFCFLTTRDANRFPKNQKHRWNKLYSLIRLISQIAQILLTQVHKSWCFYPGPHIFYIYVQQKHLQSHHKLQDALDIDLVTQGYVLRAFRHITKSSSAAGLCYMSKRTLSTSTCVAKLSSSASCNW